MTITNPTQTTPSPAQAAAQEAKETAAQTKAEAAKGDQQAIRKLAAEQAAQPQAAKVDSNRGLINTKA
jgi:hypothetical protein